MHELSLCENILQIVLRKVADDPCARVTKVTLSMGAHAGVSQEALAFCFPAVCKGTVAEGASLVFKITKGTQLRVAALEVLS